jgi:hypothetical protein
VVTSIIVVVDEGDAVASVLPGPAVSYTTSWDSTVGRLQEYFLPFSMEILHFGATPRACTGDTS